MLGNCAVIHAWAEADRDFILSRVGDVDLVDADAIFSDDLELRQRLVDHGLCDLVIATKECIEVAREFEHLRFTQWAALANDFCTSAFEKCMMIAGAILVRRGSE